MIRISKKKEDKYKDNILGVIYIVKSWEGAYVVLTDGKRDFPITHKKLNTDFTKVEN
jgi:hypothetical protein